MTILTISTTPRPMGIVRRMNPSRGFGFIESNDGSSRFFHRTMCLTPYELLHDGDAVYFTPDDTSPSAREKGPRATDVQRLSL